uniref:Uncharacterized protein n=1 Tax=Anguilla anguilla TaxID=7936 RepID=A0A0E9PE44_ANGAN
MVPHLLLLHSSTIDMAKPILSALPTLPIR